MTRKEVYDHLIKCKCDFFNMNDYGESPCIGVRNPANGAEFHLELPIDDRRMRDASVALLYGRLGIDTPDCAKHVEPLLDHLAERKLYRFAPPGKNDKRKKY